MSQSDNDRDEKRVKVSQSDNDRDEKRGNGANLIMIEMKKEVTEPI